MNLLEAFENSAQTLTESARATRFAFGVRKHGSGPRIVILAGIHGNEVGGIGVQLELMKHLAGSAHDLTFAIGHPEAVKAGTRFIERDINRSFGTEKTDTLESRRAKEVEEILRQADLVIDLHQTVQPSVTPFFLTEFNPSSIDAIRRIKSTLPIVTHKGRFSADGMTCTQFAQSKGAAAFTIELGTQGLHPDQIAIAVPLVIDAITRKTQDNISARVYTWDQTILRDGHTELIPGLINFSPLKKGATIALRDGVEVKAEHDCFGLFPKYGELAKTSAELLKTVRRIENWDEWQKA